MNRKQRRQAARLATTSRSFDAAVMAAHRQSDLQRELESGLGLHRAGDLQNASQIYRRILEQDPDHARATHYLGVAASQMGDRETALAYLQRSVVLDPAAAEFHNNLGTVLQACGRLDDAVGQFERSLALKPDHAAAHNNLGNALHGQGKHGDAVASYRMAIALSADFAAAHSNLGRALWDQSEFDQAIAAYRRAIALDPNLAGAHNALGGVLLDQGDAAGAVAAFERCLKAQPGYAVAHNNLGSALLKQDRLAEAEASFRRAVALDPDLSEACNNLGNALQKQGKLEEAIASYRVAIERRPDFAEAHNNLGNALRGQERFDDAVESIRTAIALKPNFAEAYTNLGNARQDQGKLEEAIALHDETLRLRPDDAEVHCNRANPLLRLGRLAQGWRAYEYRLRKPDARTLLVPAPRWDGEALDGKTILVHAEQGIGDEILFASCIPDLIARAGHCVVECEPRLGDLFARSFPEATVRGMPRTELMSWIPDVPPIDVYVMLGSLMHHFRPTLASFPDHDGYLQADAAARDRFADRLATLGPGLKVGISWRSMQGSRWQASYTALEDWSDILARSGVAFVNLQYDDSRPEAAEVRERRGVQVHEAAGLDLLNDMDGVAALISALDLVIAPGNTVAALAGALGTPVWLLDLVLNWGSLGADDYPWFPDATVYRRTVDMADWDIVLARVARDLEALIAAER